MEPRPPHNAHNQRSFFFHSYWVDGNAFSGTVPTEIGLLTMLEALDLCTLEHRYCYYRNQNICIVRNSHYFHTFFQPAIICYERHCQPKLDNWLDFNGCLLVRNQSTSMDSTWFLMMNQTRNKDSLALMISSEDSGLRGSLPMELATLQELQLFDVGKFSHSIWSCSCNSNPPCILLETKRNLILSRS